MKVEDPLAGVYSSHLSGHEYPHYADPLDKERTMAIPKVIYQTWKTKNLHENCLKVTARIQDRNPDYQILLYDDNDMDAFIKDNFEKDIYSCYRRLNVGAARADFWRYCVLYVNGGVYLDMDSEIVQSLDNLIRGDEQCIVTRERNEGSFNNWIMIFERHHPVLMEAIRICCGNIINRTTDDIAYLTGPAGPFTDAINKIMVPIYGKNTHLYFEADNDLNKVLDGPENNVRCRFFGFDMEGFGLWKHEYCRDLYADSIYWRDERRIFIDL